MYYSLEERQSLHLQHLPNNVHFDNLSLRFHLRANPTRLCINAWTYEATAMMDASACATIDGPPKYMSSFQERGVIKS